MDTLLYVGGIMSLLWGIVHLFPTKNVISDFGEITEDNKRIIAMEWINEGATLIFLGALVIAITISDPQTSISLLVYWSVVIMLLALAVISLFTGFKVNFLPFRLCPLIFSLSAICIILGILL